ncbi:type II toxin-antitoxin system RelE/ParE family toxin [Streptomyces bobili]|uniref:type II toxin-antitoxin system RelE family toxin n=1 Tax=Streptomyces bobili TaxID=67280 RepID=UPI00341BE151
MTYEIEFEPHALDMAARFLQEDPSGLALLLDSIDKLAHDPRPAGSIPYGAPDLRRLRIGDYRVLYVIDEAVIRVLATWAGRHRPYAPIRATVNRRRNGRTVPYGRGG